MFQATALSERYVQANDMLHKATEYYNKMTSSVPNDLLNTWLEAITLAESRRKLDRTVMDILCAKSAQNDPQPLSLPDDSLVSADKWLHLALSIEERQYVFSYSL